MGGLGSEVKSKDLNSIPRSHVKTLDDRAPPPLNLSTRDEQHTNSWDLLACWPRLVREH